MRLGELRRRRIFQLRAEVAHLSGEDANELFDLLTDWDAALSYTCLGDGENIAGDDGVSLTSPPLPHEIPAIRRRFKRSY